VLPIHTLTQTRDYSFDETAILAKEQEQEIIRRALAHDIAALVLRRLAAITP
jgi:LPS-assembly lipoprotein